jgi:hypothetical protein
MNHRVVLSNGRVLLVEERWYSLHIATETEGFEGDVDAFICEINPSGVLVMPNSGDATNFITEGLKS